MERRIGTSSDNDLLAPQTRSVPVVFLKPVHACAPQLLQRLKEIETLQVYECTLFLEVKEIFEKEGCCLLICNASTQADLVQHATIMKLFMEPIAAGTMRVLLTSVFQQPVLLEKLKAYGFYEIFPDPVDEKKLASRIERASRGLVRGLSRNLGQPSRSLSPRQAQPQPLSSVQTVVPSQIVSDEENISMISALKLESDFWLFIRQGTHRTVNRWVVHLMGPGLSVGRFVAVDDGPVLLDPQQSTSKEEQWWKWVPLESRKDEFLKENGTWYFWGLAPRFEEGSWFFAAKHPALSFFSEEKCLASKFFVDGKGILNVAFDSLNAIRLRSQIESTAYESSVQKTEMEQGIFSNEENFSNPSIAPSEFSEKIKHRLAEALGDSSAQAREILARLDQKVSVQSAFHQEGALKEKLAVKGPAAIQAKKSLEPRLGPLAVSLLMSELTCKTDLSKEKMAHEFCQYVGASCGGLRVELWYFKSDQWSCAGTNDNTPGQMGSVLGGFRGGAVKLGQEALVGGILNANQQLMGAMVLAGKEVENLSVEYILAVGKTTLGLLEAFVFSENDRSPVPIPDAEAA